MTKSCWKLEDLWEGFPKGHAHAIQHLFFQSKLLNFQVYNKSISNGTLTIRTLANLDLG